MTSDKILITLDRETFIKLCTFARRYNIDFMNKSGGIVRILQYITRDIEVATTTNFVNEMLDFGFIPAEKKGGSVLITEPIKPKPTQQHVPTESSIAEIVKRNLNKENHHA